MVGTIFPNAFPGPLALSCIGRGIGTKWNLEISDLRSFAFDKHKSIDDKAFGDMGGMVMKCEVIHRFFQEFAGYKKVYVSPRGNLLKQNLIERLLTDDLCILCGRYEGVDVRVLQHWEVEEISLGDFILHGGEVAAMTLIEVCARKLVVKSHSFLYDTFSHGLLEHDQYTRPAIWTPENGDSSLDSSVEKSYNVPEVLISGNHKKMSEWRIQNSFEITKRRRPDLWKTYLEEHDE